jgi:hypothetical protein
LADLPELKKMFEPAKHQSGADAQPKPEDEKLKMDKP